tara:strand:+ start:2224 stop:2553 length:330 start_codon:yes stop_codon:yes gene_type:complete
MRRPLLVLAYCCIWSTPFQVGIVLWAMGVVISTDVTILSLTNDIFVNEYLPKFYMFIKPLTYFIFPDAFADFIWSLPTVIHQILKAIVSTWLGLWMLPIAKGMPEKKLA